MLIYLPKRNKKIFKVFVASMISLEKYFEIFFFSVCTGIISHTTGKLTGILSSVKRLLCLTQGSPIWGLPRGGAGFVAPTPNCYFLEKPRVYVSGRLMSRLDTCKN